MPCLESELESSLAEEDARTISEAPKAKKARPKAIKVPGEPKPKRGPARPHRRLDIGVVNSRIEKLQKRLDRAKGQVEDASRHIEGYQREREFREKEGEKE
jgi:hypothetical protein